MKVVILSPERPVFEGEATAVVAPAYDGEVGILPRHAPFMTLLGEGRLLVRRQEGTQEFKVKGGFLQVRQDTVRVVAEYATEVTNADS
ncbi:MAG: ATP synthase epsilon chain [Gemmatimonadales bacterium]|nr:ATP synthase epsilon chain [bacterium HR33]GIW51826.1 MAG: ATP synthase epsilon chain [Gemmatimonadales bacterium]